MISLSEIRDVALQVIGVAAVIAPWIPVPRSNKFLMLLRKFLIDMPAQNYGWARNEHPERIRAEKLAKKQRRIGGKPGRR